MAPLLDTIPVVDPLITCLRASSSDLGLDLGSLFGAVIEICVVALMGATLGDIDDAMDGTLVCS